MKNLISHHSIGYLNYISELTNNGTLLDLLSAPWNFFLNYVNINFYQQSKPRFKIIVKLSILKVAWIKCRYWNIPEIFQSTYSLRLLSFCILTVCGIYYQRWGLSIDIQVSLWCHWWNGQSLVTITLPC